MRCTLLAITLLFALHTTAQTNNTQDTAGNAPMIFKYVEQMPMAPFDMRQYLSENLHYPKKAIEKNIEGRVIIKFIVTETGIIDSAHVVSGIGGGCDEEALRVVNTMPRWKPGKQNGKYVRVYFNPDFAVE